jgi:chromate transporter
VGVVAWLAPLALVALLAGRHHVLADEGLFFSKVAVVTFGGAYAVLAYVAQQAVEVYGWLSPAEMLDGLGLAETTPGPLIMVLQFVGFLGAFRAPGGLDPWLAGIIGSLVTTWATFAPSFGFILAGAPWGEYLRGNRRLNAALAGIMAAVGVVHNLALWLGLHTLFGSVETVRAGPTTLLRPDRATVHWGAVAIAAAATVALVRFRGSLLLVLGLAALIGAAGLVF